MSNLEEPRPQKLALNGLSERPHCMAVIEPRHTLSGCVEVGGLPGLTQRLLQTPVLRLAKTYLQSSQYNMCSIK